MKILKITILSFIAGLLLYSCADPDLSPILTFEKSTKGGYARLVELIKGEYDLEDIPGSVFQYKVEFVTIDKGENVSSYDITVAFDDNNPDNGDDSKDFQTYKTFSQADFTTNADGFKEIEVSIPLTDVASSMGLNTADLIAGDIFEFKTFVRLDDGNSYGNANSSAAVQGSAFQGFFDFDAKATCPLNESEFTGVYTVTYISRPESEGLGWAFGDDPGEATLATVAGSSTNRTFTFKNYLPDTYVFDPIVLTMDFVCDELQMAKAFGSGVGCGGELRIIQGAVTSFDRSDQSELILDVIETPGGCYGADRAYQLRLTKN